MYAYVLWSTPFDSPFFLAGILGLPMQMNVFLKGGFMEIIAWISVEAKKTSDFSVPRSPRRSKNVPPGNLTIFPLIYPM